MPQTRRLIRDSSKVNNLTVFIIGVCAGGVVSLFSTLLAATGLARLEIELLLGSLFTGSIDQQTALLGLALFLVLSGFVAFAYAFIFRSAHRSGGLIGVNLSFFHWVVSGFVIGLFPVFHPLLRESTVDPGFFMVGLGFATSVAFFFAHVIFGMVVGQLFDKAALRDEYPQPLTTGSHYQRREPTSEMIAGRHNEYGRDYGRDHRQPHPV